MYRKISLECACELVCYRGTKIKEQNTKQKGVDDGVLFPFDTHYLLNIQFERNKFIQSAQSIYTLGKKQYENSFVLWYRKWYFKRCVDTESNYRIKNEKLLEIRY